MLLTPSGHYDRAAILRFAQEAAPALESFAQSSPAPFLAGIKAARDRIVARKDEDREAFLRGQGFSKPETDRIIASVLAEDARRDHCREFRDGACKCTGFGPRHIDQTAVPAEMIAGAAAWHVSPRAWIVTRMSRVAGTPLRRHLCP